MASDDEQSDGNRAAPAHRPMRRPPKPNRPAAAPAAADDDDLTVRVSLRDTAGSGLFAEPPQPPIVASSSAPLHLPVSPPLPSAPGPSDQTPVALEIPKREAATLRRLLGGRYAKIGAGIFAVGVLVGVVGAVTVIGNRAAPVALATAPAAPTVDPPKAAAVAAKPAPAIAPARERDDPPEAKAENVAPIEVEKLALESIEPPVSGSRAPSCRELLGKSVVVRHDPTAALRETRLANRALVLGNVVEAQAAFCKALTWDFPNIERRVNLGRLFLVRRDWAKAAEHGQSALELDPKNRRALGVVGDAWAALNKTKEARSAWLLAERKPKASPSERRLIVRRNMALAQRVERLQDFSAAERLYRRVLLLEPEHANAMRGIARCLLRVGDPRAAEIWARKAEAPKRTAAPSKTPKASSSVSG